jgi:hypothetical protein
VLGLGLGFSVLVSDVVRVRIVCENQALFVELCFMCVLDVGLQ